MEVSKVLSQVQDRAHSIVQKATEELKSGDSRAKFAKRQERLLKRMSKPDEMV